MAEKYYIDLDYNLTKNTLSDDISIKYDLNAIAQSIKNIVLTTKNEKIFNYDFGTSLTSISFQTLYNFELQNIKFEIAAELALQEPRANITNINIQDSGLGYWQVDITFSAIYDRNLIRTITIPLE